MEADDFTYSNIEVCIQEWINAVYGPGVHNFRGYLHEASIYVGLAPDGKNGPLFRVNVSLNLEPLTFTS